MKTMMGDLIPPDIAQRLDVEALGGHIWDYTMGKISSSELTIEVAVSILLITRPGQGSRYIAKEAWQMLHPVVEAEIWMLTDYNWLKKN